MHLAAERRGIDRGGCRRATTIDGEVATTRSKPATGGKPRGGARTGLAAQLERVRLESDTLYRVIGVVASAPDLDRLLASTVELLTEAIACHACFIYLLEGGRLRLRAASRVYAHLIGKLELELSDSLAGWVARRRTPAFIRDRALDDPRMKYVPELQEEDFQSIVAVPIPARSGEVIGVVVLHTIAPREFDESAMTFLAHTASLMAGAIENARLYEALSRRVHSLTNLSALGREISAAVSSRDELYAVITRGVRQLLDCESAELELLASEAADAGREEQVDTAAVLSAPVLAGEERLGVLRARFSRTPGDDAQELLEAIAHHVALALKQVELIERLTDENVVRDLFESLASGDIAVAEQRARKARCDLARPHVLVCVEPAAGGRRGAWPDQAERVEQRLRQLSPSTLCDAGRDRLRALLSMPTTPGEAQLAELDAALRDLGAGERLAIGRSAVRHGAEEAGRSLHEAADAARIASALLPDGGSLAYDGLGAYKYLVRLPPGDTPEDRQTEAVRTLVEYDRRRRTQLVATLERYLLDRRSIATTARALYIHPNTLRQRLERIEQLSGLQLAREDLLSLELAVKLVRLRAASDAAGAARAQPATGR